MAVSIMTNVSRTQRAIDFFGNTDLFMGIGRTTSWTVDPTPDDASITQKEIEELLVIQRINSKRYVRIQTGGEITFNGIEYTEVSATEQTITAITLGFTTGTNTINDSNGALPVFTVGSIIDVIGGSNAGSYTVLTSDINNCVVNEAITTEAAGTNITIKSNLFSNNVNAIWHECIFDYDNGTPDSLPVNVTYRQVGLLENPIDIAESICPLNTYLPGSLSATSQFPQGILHYIDNRPPIIRTLTQKESISLIIEF